MNAAPSLSRSLDTEAAIEFLNGFDPVGWHNLVEIDPAGGSPKGRTFAPGEFDRMRDWIHSRNGRMNLYFSVNEPFPNAPNKKLRKENIALARALHVDFDPADGADLLAEKTRLSALVVAAPIRPTFALDSGNGVQAFWKLTEKVRVGDSPYEIETLNRAATLLLGGGGDDTQNIDRIMRLPGTLNIPNAKKRAQGRTERVAELLWSNGPVHDRAALEAALPKVPHIRTAANDDSNPKLREMIKDIEASGHREIDKYEDLPADLRRRFDTAMARSEPLQSLWNSAEPGSESRFALARKLRRTGDFDHVDHARLAWIWDFSTSKPDRDEALDSRQLARDWLRSPPSPGEELEAVDIGKEEETPRQSETVPKPERFVFETISDLRKMPPQKWFIKDWLPMDGTGVVYGAWGAFKSFIVLDLALHCAYGLKSWHGVPLSGIPSRVLVIAREGHQGFTKRLDAFKLHHKIDADTDNLVVMRSSVNFLVDSEFAALEPAVRGKGRFDLIVIDTIARVISGVDLSKPENITKYTELCARLGLAVGATTISVHHENKGGTIMGSVYFEANSDFVYAIQRGDKADEYSAKLTCTKLKEDADHWTRDIKLQRVEWVDPELGDQQSSLVVVSMTEGGDDALFAPISQAAKKLLQSLDQASDAAAGRPVAWETWVEAHYRSVDPTWEPGKAKPANCAPSTLNKRRNELVDKARVSRNPQGEFSIVEIE